MAFVTGKRCTPDSGGQSIVLAQEPLTNLAKWITSVVLRIQAVLKETEWTNLYDLCRDENK